MGRLGGMRVAILVTEGFEQSEFTEPVKVLRSEGAEVDLISPKEGKIQAFRSHDRADNFTVDRPIDEARASEYDAVMLPGGALNADVLRMNEHARDFVRWMEESQRPIAAICHAPWLLVSAGLVRGKRLTSYYTLQDDIRNAGGEWLDQEVVRDGNWVTSRGPKDLPAFTEEMVGLFAENREEKPPRFETKHSEPPRP